MIILGPKTAILGPQFCRILVLGPHFWWPGGPGPWGPPGSTPDVNLHDVTNLRFYNKLILVTQKQVLELYITVIEHKTLYGLCVPHTAFPDATEATTRETTNEVHVTRNRGIRNSHNLVEKCRTTGFYPTIKEN